jgi:sialic acid synthase SpsE
VDFLERYDVPAYKVASAGVTDISLLTEVAETEKPVIMSTGMSEMSDVKQAMRVFDPTETALMNCVATYPAQDSDLNLSGMETLRKVFGVPVGHSGHELGIATTVGAVAMGAELVERHITLNRASWGSDQAASLEPQGFKRMVRDIRAVERAWGDGIIRIQDCERDKLADLRGG